jgi:hypothetical protein
MRSAAFLQPVYGHRSVCCSSASLACSDFRRSSLEAPAKPLILFGGRSDFVAKLLNGLREPRGGRLVFHRQSSFGLAAHGFESTLPLVRSGVASRNGI